MEILPDIQFREDLRLIVWRPRGILDEAAVNKVLVDLLRREAMAAKPFNRFPISQSSSLFTSLSNMFFMSLFTGAFPTPVASR
jgi:hypothetical protein